MKRVLNLFVIVGMLITFTACSKKEQTRTFKIDGDGRETTIVYTFEDDKLLKQNAETKMNYIDLGVSNKEEAKTLIDSVASAMEGVKGYKSDIIYEEDYFLEKIEIDFTKVDLEEIQKLLGGSSLSKEADYISLEKSVDMLLSAGFEEVK